MENNIDQTLQQWGRVRQARLGSPDEETISAVMRRVRQRAESPRTPVEHSRQRTVWRWAFLALGTAAVAAVAAIVSSGVRSHHTPEPGPLFAVYQVRCEPVMPPPEMHEPLVQLARYEALFQEN